MIRSFKCKDTEKLYGRLPVPRFKSFERVARRKLMMLNQSRSLNDLKQPPGNRLETLKGNRAGQYSIRINDQWRICFEWRAMDAFNVEIVDYH